MRVRLDLGYDGTDFHGWQVQKDKRTVQGELELALWKLLGERVSLVGSGRTDAGVHARWQVAVFDVEAVKMPVERIAFALKRFLPRDILVFASSKVKDTFHPRKDCKEKVYRYFLHWGMDHPVISRYSLFIKEGIWNRINELDYLFDREGRFSVFACNRGDESHLSDKVWRVQVRTGKIKERIGFIEFRSKSFLYRMVRRMVGLMLEVANGRLPVSVVEEVFAGKRVEWSTAPPQGLFLWEIRY